MVTESGPVMAPTGTDTVRRVSEPPGAGVAATPPKRTCVAPVKLRPVSTTTVVLTGPRVGVNETMTGRRGTVNGLGEVPVPKGVVTATRPVMAL